MNLISISLSDVADVFSLLGVIIAAYTLWRVSSIKKSIEETEKKIIFHRRIEKLLEDLKTLNLEYYNLLFLYKENKNEKVIEEYLPKLESKLFIICNNAYKKSSWERECNNVIKSINNLIVKNEKNETIHNSELKRIYSKISTLIDLIENEVLNNTALYGSYN